jgi:hypothetical protein
MYSDPHLATTGPKQLLAIPAKTPVSMQSREEIFATLQRLKGDIAARFSVSRIGIFGSVARGEQTEASDIDILVEFSRPIGFFAFIELEEFLSRNLGAPVDLVTPDALKPIIRERVAAEVAYA